MDALEMVRKMPIKDLEVLLKNKALDINMQDEDGNTLMHDAVRDLNSERIEVLLRYNANLELANKKGNTPLCSCVWIYTGTGDPVLIEIYHKLVAAGANRQHPSGNGGSISEMAEEFEMIR